MDDAYAHCEALVREQDRNQYLASLYAPAHRRHHLYAISAFALEIARVPDLVREPMAGEIRLQWWRDVLKGERREEAAAHPVAAALLNSLAQRGLSSEELSATVDAHGFALLGQPMPSREALLEYVDAVFGIPLRMSAAILAPEWNSTDAIFHGAQAAGVASILRRLARDIAKGRVFVPLDLLGEHEVHTASVLAGEASEELSAALQDLRNEALAAFARLRSVHIPQIAMPALLPLALVPDYLRLGATAKDPFQTLTELSRLKSLFVLWRTARRGHF